MSEMFVTLFSAELLWLATTYFGSSEELEAISFQNSCVEEYASDLYAKGIIDSNELVNATSECDQLKVIKTNYPYYSLYVNLVASSSFLYLFSQYAYVPAIQAMINLLASYGFKLVITLSPITLQCLLIMPVLALSGLVDFWYLDAVTQGLKFRIKKAMFILYKSDYEYNQWQEKTPTNSFFTFLTKNGIYFAGNALLIGTLTYLIFNDFRKCFAS